MFKTYLRKKYKIYKKKFNFISLFTLIIILNYINYYIILFY